MSEIALSIISPMFNEEENVSVTVGRIGEALAGLKEAWELVLVDDGSTDGTLAVARELESRHEWLRVVGYSPNRGRGMALRTGFAEARGKFIVTTDFDLSYSPDHIKRIYDELAANPDLDMVLGSAYMPGGTVKDVPWRRHLVSRAGNRVLSFAMGGSYKTITCILRGYKRESLLELEMEEEGKEIHLEILSRAHALGYRIKEIPADLRGRTGGTSKFKFGSTSTSHLLFSLLERPTMIFGAVGFSLFLMGIIAGLFIVVMRYQGTLNPTRPLVTLMTILVIAGIQIFTLGFMSLLLVNLRKEIYRVQQQNRRLEIFLGRLDKKSGGEEK